MKNPAYTPCHPHWWYLSWTVMDMSSNWASHTIQKGGFGLSCFTLVPRLCLRWPDSPLCLLHPNSFNCPRKWMRRWCRRVLQNEFTYSPALSLILSLTKVIDKLKKIILFNSYNFVVYRIQIKKSKPKFVPLVVLAFVNCLCMYVCMLMSFQTCGNLRTTCWRLFSPENNLKLLPLYHGTIELQECELPCSSRKSS